MILLIANKGGIHKASYTGTGDNHSRYSLFVGCTSFGGWIGKHMLDTRAAPTRILLQLAVINKGLWFEQVVHTIDFDC